MDSARFVHAHIASLRGHVLLLLQGQNKVAHHAFVRPRFMARGWVYPPPLRVSLAEVHWFTFLVREEFLSISEHALPCTNKKPAHDAIAVRLCFLDERFPIWQGCFALRYPHGGAHFIYQSPPSKEDGSLLVVLVFETPRQGARVHVYHHHHDFQTTVGHHHLIGVAALCADGRRSAHYGLDHDALMLDVWLLSAQQ